jgi:hypothetical protein
MSLARPPGWSPVTPIQRWANRVAGLAVTAFTCHGRDQRRAPVHFGTWNYRGCRLPRIETERLGPVTADRPRPAAAVIGSHETELTAARL